MYTRTACLSLFGLAALLALGSSASAEEVKADSRPGFSVSPEVQARFAAQRDKATRPRRLVPTVEVKTNLRIVARLARYDDGVVLVSVPVTEKRKQVLLRLGASEVETASAIRSHTIHEGRYYRAYAAHELDPVLFEKHVGQKVRLHIQRTSDGRTRVAGIAGT